MNNNYPAIPLALSELRNFLTLNRVKQFPDETLGVNRRPLSAYRIIAYHYFLMTIVVAFPPYMVYNLLVGQYWLLFSELVVTAMAGLSIVQLIRQQKPVVTPVVASAFIVALMGFPSFHVNPHSMFWAYDLAFFLHFLLRPAAARNLNMALLLIVVPGAYINFSYSIATAYTLSLFAASVSFWVFFYFLRGQDALLQELATTDPLTGALNRRSLDLKMQESQALLDRYSLPSAMILIDLDHFKGVNDNFGHQQGDQVLCQLVALVSQRFRQLDNIYRYGGEEFALILPKTNRDEATVLAEQLCLLISRTEFIAGRVITASFGVAALRPEEDAGSWLLRCDEALYRAKDEGRNRVCWSS